MERLKLYAYGFILTLFTISASCTSSTKTSENKEEVAAMDSITNELDKTNKELEDQAKKLEESLDNAEKEFNTAK